MSKKFYVAFVPLIAIVASASMSAMAQAAPHWYVCQKESSKIYKYKDAGCTETTTTGEYELKRLPFENGGTKTTVKGSGELTFSYGTGTMVCTVTEAGSVWNTTLAQNGKDEFTAFTFSGCHVSPESACPRLAVATSNLPWATELEVAEGVMRDKIKDIKITIECPEQSFQATFEGELAPKLINNKPSYFEFDAGSGVLRGTLGDLVFGGDFSLEGASGKAIQAFNP